MNPPIYKKLVKSRLSFVHTIKKIWFVLPILVTCLLIFWWSGNSASDNVFNYVLGKDSTLESGDGHLNILLLGIAGEKHEGPNLTDTIIVVSYNILTHKVSLISLPRDLWIEKYKVKVNSLYAIGLNRNNGLGFTRDEISQILGINIPYAIRIDFNGFTRAVDEVGGVDVDVPKSFEDYQYPVVGKETSLCDYEEKEVDITEEQSQVLGIPVGKQKALIDKTGAIATASSELQKGIAYSDSQVVNFFPCRFDILKFKQGITHMDGEMALKYVRSRHGNNGEGSDFARSRRQQLVLQAFRNKILSVDTLLDPSRILSLVKAFSESLDTNISPTQYLDLIKLVQKMDKVESFVIDQTGKEPLLIAPKLQDYGGAWVLIPAVRDYSKIQSFVKTIIEGNSTGSARLSN